MNAFTLTTAVVTHCCRSVVVAVVSGKPYEVVGRVFVVEKNGSRDSLLSECWTLKVDSETGTGLDVSQSERNNKLSAK